MNNTHDDDDDDDNDDDVYINTAECCLVDAQLNTGYEVRLYCLRQNTIFQES